METRREERIGQLLQELKRSDKLHLKDAAALLGVSEMTIRRDLNNHSAPVVFARRLYCSGTAQRQPLPVKRSKNPARWKKNALGSKTQLRRW